MRTFHTGGTATIGGDITQGLPRGEEIFEKRKPKHPAVISHVNGVVTDVKKSGTETIITILSILNEKSKSKAKNKIEYSVHLNRIILVKENDKVEKGDMLTDGSADVDELFKFAGKEKTENYIIREISKLYELQGETVSRKHIELIVRQMFGRKIVKDQGATSLSAGDVVENAELFKENKKVREKELAEAKAEAIVMGITEVSLSRKSFLSAASFQHTTRVLIGSAVKGNVDNFVGLKENVIIGRLIPAGTGFRGSPKEKMIRELKESRNL